MAKAFWDSCRGYFVVGWFELIKGGGKSLVVGFKEFEGFGDGGHGFGGGFDNIGEFLESKFFVKDKLFTVMINFFLELLILNALDKIEITRSSSLAASFLFLSFPFELVSSFWFDI